MSAWIAIWYIFAFKIYATPPMSYDNGLPQQNGFRSGRQNWKILQAPAMFFYPNQKLINFRLHIGTFSVEKRQRDFCRKSMGEEIAMPHQIWKYKVGGFIALSVWRKQQLKAIVLLAWKLHNQILLHWDEILVYRIQIWLILT